MAPKNREPVAYTAIGGQYPITNHHHHCVCRDGSHWEWDTGEDEWHELKPIPGSERDRELNG